MDCGGHRAGPSLEAMRHSRPQGCEPTGGRCWSCPGVLCCGGPRAHLSSCSRTRPPWVPQKGRPWPTLNGRATSEDTIAPRRPTPRGPPWSASSRRCLEPVSAPGGQNHRASVTKGERPRFSTQQTAPSVKITRVRSPMVSSQRVRLRHQWEGSSPFTCSPFMHVRPPACQALGTLTLGQASVNPAPVRRFLE